MGAWGLGGLLEGERVREKGVGEEWGKLGGLGLGGGYGYGIREVYISTKGVILGFTRDLIINGIPGPKRSPDCSLDRGEGA